MRSYHQGVISFQFFVIHKHLLSVGPVGQKILKKIKRKTYGGSDKYSEIFYKETNMLVLMATSHPL
jgi:hypothetical protein